MTDNLLPPSFTPETDDYDRNVQLAVDVTAMTYQDAFESMCGFARYLERRGKPATLPSAGGETSGTATPQTDDQPMIWAYIDLNQPCAEVVYADFARQLERELQEAKTAMANLQKHCFTPTELESSLAAARADLETMKESHDELLEFKRQCDAEGFIPASVAQLLDNTETERDAARAELAAVKARLEELKQAILDAKVSESGNRVWMDTREWCGHIKELALKL